jgi:hypothetical protein
MNNAKSWLPAAIAVVAAVVVVGLQLSQGSRIDVLEERTGAAGDAVGKGDDLSGGATSASLADRVESLEREMAELRERRERRMAMRGDRGAREGRMAGLGPRALSDEELARASSSGGDPSDALVQALDSDDPEVRERLRDVVLSEMQAENERRWETRTERWKQHAKERLDEAAEEHDWSPEQVQKLSMMLDAERDELSGVFRAARENMQWREAREKAREVREKTDENALAVLDDEAYAGWTEMREGERNERRERRNTRRNTR